MFKNSLLIFFISHVAKVYSGNKTSCVLRNLANLELINLNTLIGVGALQVTASKPHM